MSNDELVYEVIRRVRGRMLPTGGYEGAKVRSVLEALRPLMTNQEITISFKRLLDSKNIIMTGRLKEYNPQVQIKDEWRATGIVHSLHPEIVLKKETYYFSLTGSLLREARRNGRLIEPSQNTRFLWLHLSMCYVMADGLPEKIKRELLKPPLPQPVLPEYAWCVKPRPKGARLIYIFRDTQIVVKRWVARKTRKKTRLGQMVQGGSFFEVWQRSDAREAKTLSYMIVFLLPSERTLYHIYKANRSLIRFEPAGFFVLSNFLQSLRFNLSNTFSCHPELLPYFFKCMERAVKESVSHLKNLAFFLWKRI